MLERIGHYRIVEELGRGGMGTVYRAHEESLNRSVAIKVLGEHLAHDPEYVKRFLREARSAAALSHPNIVQIYFIGEEDGKHFFVMEYVQGRSLHQILHDDGPIDVERSVRYLKEAVSGLAEAHDHGVIHRDIKPANLMIDRSDRLKIADFGLALVPGEAATRLTATGTFMGTPGYLSPEQCLGEEVDHRSDVYSLGITWYELLTGEMPFSADSPAAVLVRVVQVEPPPIESLRPEVDERLRAILGKMIAKDPGNRYADAHALLADLEAYVPGVPSSAATTGGATVLMDDAAAGPPPAPPPAPPAPPGAASESLAGAPPSPPPASAPAEAAAAPPPVAQADSGGSGSRAAVLWALVILLLLAGAGLAGAWQMGWLEGWTGVEQADGAADESREATDPASSEADSNLEESGTAGRDASSDTEPVEVAETSREFGGLLESFGLGGAEGGTAEVDGSGNDAGSPPSVEYERDEGRVDSLGSAGGSRTPERDVDAAGSRAERLVRETERDAATPEPDRKVQSEPPPPPRPRGRGVAVVAVGEPLLAGEVERALETRWANAGVELFDEKGLAGSSSLFRGADANLDLGSAMAALEGHARRLVLVRVEYLGDRELSYLGRRDVAYQSRVTVTPVDLFTGNALGSSQSTTLEYTQLTAPEVADEGLRDLARELAPAL